MKEVEAFIKKSKVWNDEMNELRSIILTAKLEEHIKWRLPCYTSEENNVVIIQPFKKCLALMFFKGALLKDPKNILVKNGPNSNAPKRLEFTSVSEIKKLEPTIKKYLKEAIEIEKKGLKVEKDESSSKLIAPEELTAFFKSKPALKKAFEALTPGRQRAYLIHFSGAKQSSTRTSRIEKCIPLIMMGKGWNER